MRRGSSTQRAVSFPAPLLLSRAPGALHPHCLGQYAFAGSSLAPGHPALASCREALATPGSRRKDQYSFLRRRSFSPKCVCAPIGSVAIPEPVYFTWQAPLSPFSSSAHSMFSSSCGIRSKHSSLLMSFIRAFCSTWDAGTATGNRQVRREGLTKLQSSAVL